MESHIKQGFNLINKNSSKPIYRQLVEIFAIMIKENIVKDGEKLPSINKLSKHLKLSRATVEAAYLLLSNQNLIIKSRGKGHYVDLTQSDVLTIPTT
jgi:GntR family transcriptional regulator/MocR family aminotransferase